MKKRVINTLIGIILLSGMPNVCHAFDLDETVDDEIRKTYKTEEENLPALPAITKHIESTPAKVQPIVYTTGNTRVKKGTSYDVVNTSKISDWQKTGTTVKFKTGSTVFTGEIVESHQPQITCNGGLVAIQVHSMSYNGQTVPINAYVTRANGKKIFLNNIKGERNYLKTTWKKGNWGRTLFGRMMNLTVNLGGEGSTLILSPFPFAYGTICLGLNTITSPVCAFFSKGGHVSIPAGANFRIKLTEDAWIN